MLLLNRARLTIRTQLNLSAKVDIKTVGCMCGYERFSCEYEQLYLKKKTSDNTFTNSYICGTKFVNTYKYE